MIYQITGLSGILAPSDIDGAYDNPKSAKSDLMYLRSRFPDAALSILKDGVGLSDDELDAEIESYEIQAVRKEATQLPGTYRHGRGAESDDVALGGDGNPTKVWGPRNPEDRYE